jgi:hypothetical protein
MDEEYDTHPGEWAEHDATAEPIGTVFRDIQHGEPPF